MKNLPFKSSNSTSIGIELECQIIDPETYDLAARAKELIREIREGPYQKIIKPEITQSMIEVNSSIHTSTQEMYNEIKKVFSYLDEKAKYLEVYISGGGTHPFQLWTRRKIFPTKRFKKKSKLYRYLSKCSTVFGVHLHIGCATPEDAIYLTHAFARYVPHLIAMSASSPFYQGIDTGYHSSRATVFNAFPLSGVMPYFTQWETFSDYYYKLKELGVIETMKDVYWDIRPKPEFGTVELRVCDTPLTIQKAIQIAAYVQSLAHYLIMERPTILSPDLYYLYSHNRFQASRFGLEADLIHPATLEHIAITADILNTFKIIEKSASYLKNTVFLHSLIKDVISKQNDAVKLRELYRKYGSLNKVVHEQCSLWAKKR